VSDNFNEPRAKSRTFLLIVSLAFNIFFVGSVVGGVFIGKRIHERTEAVRHAPPIHSFANPRQLMRYVEPEQRDELSAILREEMKSMKPLLVDVGERRRFAMKTLRASPFDQEKSEAAFASLAASEAKAHQASSRALMKMLKKLPEEERAALVERMSQRRHDRGGSDSRHEKWGKMHHRSEKPAEKTDE
jgi:uncharacterized membrane protein